MAASLTQAFALQATTHTITEYDIYSYFYNTLFGSIFTHTGIHGIPDNPADQFIRTINLPTPTSGLPTLPTGVQLICQFLTQNAYHLFKDVTEKFPKMQINGPQLNAEMNQLFADPVSFWRDLSKSVDTKIKKFVQFNFTADHGHLLTHPDGRSEGLLSNATSKDIKFYTDKGFSLSGTGPVIDTSQPTFKPVRTRQYVESVSQGHFSTPDQCINVIGPQEWNQTCSICGRQIEPGESFSCEHTLEVLLLIICCTLSPSVGDEEIRRQIYEFLTAINAYTWCCERCNMLKAYIQGSSGIFINVVTTSTAHGIPTTNFCRNELAIGQYIPILFSSWGTRYFITGTESYYIHDPTTAKYFELTTDTQTRIHGIIDPLINALNSLYIPLWGSFQNMMLFGIIKIIAMMGKINCYPLPKLPKTPKNPTGGSKLTNITNTKIKYNMKGGVTPMEESMELIKQLDILRLINYYALHCTELPDFSDIVNIVIKLQRWLRRSREKITERERYIINFDPETITSATNTDAIFENTESINHSRFEKLNNYVKLIIENGWKLDDKQQYKIIKFIKNFDEDEQNEIIQKMIKSGIPREYLSELFSQELRLEQILEEVKEDNEEEEPQPTIENGLFAFTQPTQTKYNFGHMDDGMDGGGNPPCKRKRKTIKRKSKRRKSKRRRNNKRRSRK